MGNQIVTMTVSASTTAKPQPTAAHSPFPEFFYDKNATSADGVDPTKSKKPCRACTDFKSWAKLQFQKRQEEKSSSSSSNSSSSHREDGKQHPPLKEDLTEAEKEYEELLAKRAHLQCPLDKDELGRSTWSFLHTMAAYFPDNPSKSQQKEMSAFMKIFAKYYPCEHCAQDFQKSIKESPPETDSRTDFSQWMCKMHNEVNRKLGKPEFDCSRVDERWKDGWKDESCEF